MRFQFGQNWKNYSKHLNEDRIFEAKKDIQNFLELKELKNKTFLDVGCGSGLSSLAAKRLGAIVTSYDYDVDSVNTAKQLKEKFFKDDNSWKIFKGDVLDENFCKNLGQFDIVYSWGVLHHTGDQWKAMENIKNNIKKDGLMYLALYNNDGNFKKWLLIKKIYNFLPRYLNIFYALILYIYYEILRQTIIPILRQTIISKRPIKYTVKFFKQFKEKYEYKKNRGMSLYFDIIDWYGGYPYEVSTSNEVINFFKDFEIIKLIKNNSYGNNLFLFKKK